MYEPEGKEDTREQGSLVNLTDAHSHVNTLQLSQHAQDLKESAPEPGSWS